jgi:pimeloyl-ACP methyl ester carboxylesterase
MSSTAPERVEVDRRSLELRWAGAADPGRPTIVMLHEGLGSASMWKDFPERLAQATDCRTLAYSRAGYGRSGAKPPPWGPRYMHDEGEIVLPALLDALGIDRPILFGHSDGASIAIVFAGRFPERLRGLIVEAPHVFIEASNLESIAAAGRAFESTDLKARLARYHDDPESAFRGWNDAWLDPAFRDWTLEPYLPAIACPMLMIQGTDDEYGTTAQLDAIKARVPQAQSLLLDHCGHSPHRDRPDAVLEASAAFIQALSESAR